MAGTPHTSRNAACPGGVRARLRAQLASSSGETLVEVLLALLIIVMLIATLCTAIVTAARVNSALSPSDIAFNALPEEGKDPGEYKPVKPGDVKVTIIHNSTGDAETNCNKFGEGDTSIIDGKTQNGYWWYEPK